MIINSLKTSFTYQSNEVLDLIIAPEESVDHNLYIDYNNFINAIAFIYGDQNNDGTIPVFWTKIKNNITLEREADQDSTLKELEPNKSYYIVVLDNRYLPLKVPNPLNSKIFLTSNKQTQTNKCDISCDNQLSIISSDHRTISLNSSTGFYKDIHIQLSGLLPNKEYFYSIEPIFSNWPNKLSQQSGVILRNSPLDNSGYISSSIDTKFLYLSDELDPLDESLPYLLVDITKDSHSKNVFSLFALKIFNDHNELIANDTINIVCDSCIPTKTPTPTPTPTSTPLPTPTSTTTPTPSPSYIPNDPHYYYISDTINKICYDTKYLLLIYGITEQNGDVLYKNPELTTPWTFIELLNYINSSVNNNVLYIKNRLNNDNVINEIVNINNIATFNNYQLCPSPTPTPTNTRTPTPTPTSTPAPTPDEPQRKCPTVNIKEKNIKLTNQPYAEIEAEFTYLNPYNRYSYNFYSNESNWPTYISPKSGLVPISQTYIEDNVVYGLGTIKAILEFTKTTNSISNLSFDLPDYTSTDFFDSNLYINLGLRISRGNTGCISVDTSNIVCDECIQTSRIKDCIESVRVNIQNSNLDYPVLSQTSRPGAEILLDQSCCKSTNVLSASINGLCPNNSYRYSWTSNPNITISPSTGLLNINSENTTINMLYNLGSEPLTNIKLKIFDVHSNKYVEDNVLLRCNNNKCYNDNLPLNYN